MNKSNIKMRLLALVFFVVNLGIAQQKLTKVSQSINVTKDVTINLNSSYSNIIFDTWNKDVVEIEAYVEGKKLSKEELQKVLNAWSIDVNATKNTVTISTKGNNSNTWSYNFNNGDNDADNAIIKELKYELADIPDMHFDFHFELPELPEMPEMPELPEIPEGVSKMHFDYKAYQKDGKKYLDEYTKKFESSYGKDYAKKMEVWGEKFGKEWGEKYGKDMEAWGERFSKQMEQQEKSRAEQQKQLAAQREKHAEASEKHKEEREKAAAERRVLIEKMVNDKDASSNVKKVIKIKMPKGAKLKVNVRHGEIEFASNINNLKADLAYTKLTAQSVNGSSTSINASYSPVYVTHWNLGQLNLNYVKNATFNNVKNMILASNSSNITINNLLDTAVINGNIGDLKILKIDDMFTNLNMNLQNSNATILLPKVAYSLQYKGSKTRFTHPKKSSNDTTTTFSTGSLVNGKSIVVNAKYSKVTMK